MLPNYAELYSLSSFSFQRGASQPEELVQRAHALGYRALAITDECSVAGVVRAHVEAKRLGLQLLPGAEFSVALPDGGHFTLVALPHTLPGWGNLCEFITHLRRTSPKGTYRLSIGDIDAQALADCVVIASPVRGATPAQLVGLARCTAALLRSASPRRPRVPAVLSNSMPAAAIISRAWPVSTWLW